MTIKEEVGQATWDSWPSGAKMAICRMEHTISNARQATSNDNGYLFESQRDNVPSVAEACPVCWYGKLRDHAFGKICEGDMKRGIDPCGCRSWRPMEKKQESSESNSLPKPRSLPDKFYITIKKAKIAIKEGKTEINKAINTLEKLEYSWYSWQDEKNLRLVFYFYKPDNKC